jgi:hypothetical protein
LAVRSLDLAALRAGNGLRGRWSGAHDEQGCGSDGKAR